MSACWTFLVYYRDWFNTFSVLPRHKYSHILKIKWNQMIVFAISCHLEYFSDLFAFKSLTFEACLWLHVSTWHCLLYRVWQVEEFIITHNSKANICFPSRTQDCSLRYRKVNNHFMSYVLRFAVKHTYFHFDFSLIYLVWPFLELLIHFFLNDQYNFWFIEKKFYNFGKLSFHSMIR